MRPVVEPDCRPVALQSRTCRPRRRRPPRSSLAHQADRSTGRLLLLDGHSLAYRAFYALPVENFSTSTGQSTNAVYGFTSMLINVLRDELPTHVAVAFDVSRKTFRSELFADYKANRTKAPDEFNGQVALVKEVLAALHIPSLEVEGFEADDVIATLTVRAEREGFDVLICTGDRDALQLVSDQVTVLYPVKGVSELTRMTPEAVANKYGLTPAQYPDFAALRGDPSDNLPNIPGVGEKTATKWVSEFGDLDTLVARVDEVKGKAGDALRAHLAQVVQNRQLTELVRDVPIDAMPGDLSRQQWDREEVAKVFDSLEFRVLRDRLYATLTTAEPEAEEGFEVAGRVLARGELAGWLARARVGPGAHRRAHLGLLGVRHRRRRRRRAGDRRRRGRLVRPRRARPRRRAGLRRLDRRPGPAQGAARREGPEPRLRRPGLDAARRHERHRAVRLSRPARPAQL